ncbi:hypothetical protein BDN72DRAFT_96432 [Pluteus cervinus]|uniref:Uncharacterized protein n=1 Tax=Pluteus cervinus TaxID=181527 RepID=A0ACD2ZXT3_9AGAR|nr:hypothetical protein BDN72DRAFT_96432 [Pluteus cervinus]
MTKPKHGRCLLLGSKASTYHCLFVFQICHDDLLGPSTLYAARLCRCFRSGLCRPFRAGLFVALLELDFASLFLSWTLRRSFVPSSPLR